MLKPKKPDNRKRSYSKEEVKSSTVQNDTNDGEIPTLALPEQNNIGDLDENKGSLTNMNTKKGGNGKKKGNITKIKESADGENTSGLFNDHTEYYDTSDEEDARNTIGNIPINWYDEYSHIGYDWDGNKILKPDQGDNLDSFLKKMEDPNFWSTVRDSQTGQDVVLSDADIDIIKRIQQHCIPDSEYDDYSPLIEWFTSDVMTMPLRKFPEHKRSFLPSKDEMKRVSKYVHALKMGWMKTKKQMLKEKKKKQKEDLKFYMIWKDDTAAEEMRRIHNHIPAPKRALPDHSESYNPPEEYLFSKKELDKWNREKKSLGNKKLHFIPQKYNSLREVPSYTRYIRERFLRCLDLYMCPRAIKMKLTIEPEDLVPQLPSPKSLQPFPTVLSLVYTGHTDMVRSFSVDPSGQYLASVSDDCTLKMWEISTARMMKSIDLGGEGRCVSWCPNQSITLLAVATGKNVLLINPGIGDKVKISRTDSLLLTPPKDISTVPQKVSTAMTWEQVEGEIWESGVRIILKHFKEVKQLAWHGRGDYFATVMPEGSNRAVLIHQLSRRKSQLPFSKPKGLVQCVLFHPSRPFFFVATQRNIRVYDLVKQEMVKKLLSNAQWISTMAVHPGGDNLLVGTYDRKTIWFDLDLSAKPYKSLVLHSAAVRGVAYHRRYPLFASTSDDGSVIISHGMVYNDYLQNALIVPLKRMSYHTTVNDFSVFDVHFHPTQPWVFTSGADGTIRLYS